MFSRAERTYLEILVRDPAESARATLEVTFPNPTYRRKLLWGIRRKADRSLADWRLYSAAVEREHRILPRAPEGPPGTTPVFEDSIVTLLKGWGKRWDRLNRGRSASSATARGPR
ncbi:MAG: hypothetical protein ACRECT_07905 [Thermoplasmata archaeon]